MNYQGVISDVMLFAVESMTVTQLLQDLMNNFSTIFDQTAFLLIIAELAMILLKLVGLQ